MGLFISINYHFSKHLWEKRDRHLLDLICTNGQHGSFIYVWKDAVCLSISSISSLNIPFWYSCYIWLSPQHFLLTCMSVSSLFHSYTFPPSCNILNMFIGLWMMCFNHISFKSTKSFSFKIQRCHSSLYPLLLIISLESKVCSASFWDIRALALAGWPSEKAQQVSVMEKKKTHLGTQTQCERVMHSLHFSFSLSFSNQLENKSRQAYLTFSF